MGMGKKLTPSKGPARPKLRVAEPQNAGPQEKTVADKTEEELEKKRELTKEANDEVLEGISRPEFQNSVKAFILHNWRKKYLKVLGPYKQFLRQQPSVFTLIDHDPCNFTILKAGQSAKPVKKKKDPSLSWQKQLFKAWMLYCKATPKADRDVKVFAKAINEDAGDAKAINEDAGDAEKPASTEGDSTEGGKTRKKDSAKQDEGTAKDAKAKKRKLAK
mmetsp:Transcript_2842/g.3277  ORF Transcript_2842/g.3277 Transcript_2842/m.3277 type:complete len:218 (-) Transcript_2842:64-717(-)